MEIKCVFCEIIKKNIPSNMIFEDEDIFAFHDIQPVAPDHLLFIPKKHISSLCDLQKEDSYIIGKIFYQISLLAKEIGFSENGYRVINNVGKNGLQTVDHIHFHVMAGRKFSWPPG